MRRQAHKFRLAALAFAAGSLAAPVIVSATPSDRSTVGTHLGVAGESVTLNNSIDYLSISEQSGAIVVKLGLRQPLASLPASFSISNPARIVYDFPGVSNGLGRNNEPANVGDLRSVSVVQSGERTRLVLNLSQLAQTELRQEGKDLLILLTPTAKVASGETVPSQFFAEQSVSASGHAIRDIGFRRGRNGEALIVVDLSDAGTGIDVRQQGSQLQVDFLKTELPEALRRRLDVTDFATPVTMISTQPQGDNVRMIITPKGLWEHTAYQSDNQFIVEVKPVREDPSKLFQNNRAGYQGDKVSLNFQNIPIRELLHVFADITGFNIVVSDSVSGNVSLRLNDVPWDQALEIVMQQKGLAMRKNGSVIWIAPSDELTAKEKIALEAKQQISELEITRTESFQLNYQKAEAVKKLLTDEKQPMLTPKRGSASVDERTNKLFVNDVPSKLDDVRRLIAEIDIPVRQVLIEARIVEAEDTFGSSIGARLGLSDFYGGMVGHRLAGSDGTRFALGAHSTSLGYITGQAGSNGEGQAPVLVSNNPKTLSEGMNVSLAARGANNNPPGVFSFSLFNSAKTQFLNLELSALEADGRGKVISSPRVVTANQIEAIISQGVKIPYLKATSSGATSVAFEEAVLSLKVKPQITPDGRVGLSVEVSKDSPNLNIPAIGGIAIDKKHVKTEVLVENGGTVVIGGIFAQETGENTSRVPLLGDVPVLGNLFRQKNKSDKRTELLVFITPKVLNDQLGLR